MPTIDERLTSIIHISESLRDSLTPRVLAMHGEELQAATLTALAAVEEIKSVLESPDPARRA